jgi:hypothetical protein
MSLSPFNDEEPRNAAGLIFILGRSVCQKFDISGMHGQTRRSTGCPAFFRPTKSSLVCCKPGHQFGDILQVASQVRRHERLR